MSSPEKTSAQKVEPVLVQIQALYAVEAHARKVGLSAEERAAVRQEHSTTVLEEIESLLQDHAVSARPSTPLGKAVNYALSHWSALKAYTANGEVEIDTNLLENSIRPVALGRKNYLFAGSPAGAEAAATLYSITETCRRIDVNPYEYLVDVFRQLAMLEEPSIDAFRALTPVRWKQAGCL